MTPNTPRDHFLQLLRRDVLALDDADLDFGIYRILARRRAAVDRFLSVDLPARLDAVIQGEGQRAIDALSAEVHEAKRTVESAAAAVGFSAAFDDTGALLPEVAGLPVAKSYAEKAAERDRLAAQEGFSRDEEADLYHHLFTFFSRYYRDGDFQPQPRRGRRARYAVPQTDDAYEADPGIAVTPYNGQDVHLHWRSRGMHYAKTAEHFRVYRATDADSGRPLRFEVVAAETDRDNAKANEDRFFVPLPKQARDDDGTFVLPFEYRALTSAERTRVGKRKKEAQDALLDEGVDGVKKLPPGLTKAALTRHVTRYVKRNQRDYFVHPALGRFLRDELDYYLKAEYLDIAATLDAVTLADRLGKLQALRSVAFDLIDLLDGIETYQARLFEKRRFVFASDWLVPIRLVPESLYADVVAERRQLDAWRSDLKLDADVTVESLRERPTLVVDTRHFRQANGANPFRDRLLSSFDDIDSMTDGVLVYGENYGALRTLGPRYREAVKCTYIDPPYNTGGGDFLYKDDFARHSTWLSMMEERLRLGKAMMAPDGSVFASIDDAERDRLNLLMGSVFGQDNFVANIIWQKRYVSNATAKHLSDMHDFILFYASDIESIDVDLWPRSEAQKEAYKNPDNDPRGVWRAQDLSASKPYAAGLYEIETPTGLVVKPPPGRYWRCSRPQYDAWLSDNRITFGKSGTGRPMLKAFLSESQSGIKPNTWWSHDFAGHNKEARILFNDVMGNDVDFRNPKPTKLITKILQLTNSPKATVLDYFAGSGTTGHAVIALNRDDGGERRFLLADMGEHFWNVLLPRITKVMTTPDWKAGRPATDPHFPADPLGTGTALPEWVKRSPRLVQVIALESYDDSLDALVADGAAADVFDDTRLAYLLPDTVGEAGTADALLNRERMERPFDYALRTHTPEGEKPRPVDLVETAVLALGLRVRRRLTHDDAGRPYVAVVADDPEDRRTLVLWRTVDAAFDPARDASVLDALGLDPATFERVLVNADAALPGAESLDPVLLAALVQRDPYAVA